MDRREFIVAFVRTIHAFFLVPVCIVLLMSVSCTAGNGNSTSFNTDVTGANEATLKARDSWSKVRRVESVPGSTAYILTFDNDGQS